MYYVSLQTAPPAMPVITTNFSKPSSVEMANISGVIHVILNITWAEQPGIDYYVIQIDSHPPVLVQNTSYVAVSESPPNTSHTVRLTAVDVCDQTSETAIIDNIVLPSQPDPEDVMSKGRNSCDCLHNRDQYNGNQVICTANFSCVECFFCSLREVYGLV